MSIHAADALMGIFGFKRVADDEITLDNPPSLDDDSGLLNEGIEMGRTEELIRVLNAGVVERDARIATQEAQIKVLQSNASSWQSGYDEGRRMGGKHCMLTVDQLRAELAPIPDHSEDVRTMVLPEGYKLVPIEPTASSPSAKGGE